MSGDKRIIKSFDKLILLIFLFMPLKLTWFSILMIQEKNKFQIVLPQFVGYLLISICLGLLVVNPTLARKSGVKVRTYILLLMVLVADVFLSIFLTANTIYFRYFGVLIPPHSIRLVSHLPDLWGSIRALFSFKDVIYFADFPLYPVLFLLKIEKLPLSLRTGTEVTQKFRKAILCLRWFYSLLGLGVGIIILLGSFYDSNRQIHIKTSNIESWAGKIESSKQVEAANIGYYYFTQVKEMLCKKIRPVSRASVPYPVWLDNLRGSQPIQPAQDAFHFQKPNFVLIELESFSRFLINHKVDGQEITPNLNRMAQQGIYFKNFLSVMEYGGTSDVEFATLCSLYPLTDAPVASRCVNNVHIHSILHELKNLGYHSAFFHANRGAFWNRHIWAKKYGFDKSYFKPDFKLDEIIGMGLSDHSFLQQCIPEILTLPQPFLCYLVTLTLHYPFNLKPEYRTLDIGSSGNEILDNYFQAVHYVDEAIGTFIDDLRRHGLLENTIIFVFGDHEADLGGHTIYEKLYSDLGDSDKFMLRDRIPLIIWAENNLKPRVISNYASHIDIGPTVLYLSGSSGNIRGFLGNNLLSNSPKYFLYRYFSSDKVLLIYRNVRCQGTVSSGFQNYLQMDNREPTRQHNFNYWLNLLRYSDDVLTLDLDTSIDSDNILRRYNLIAHALGGIDGISYSNSLEAFHFNYKRGRRLFEVDLCLTSDGHLVCFHDGLESMLGLNKSIKQTRLDEFLKLKVADKYTPLSLEQLLLVMRDHKDMYLITDTKDDIEISFRQIVNLAKNIDPSLLGRIIPQIYHEADLSKVLKYHDFQTVIYTLYRTSASDEKVINFVKRNKIDAVTMSTDRFSEKLVEALAENNIISFVHTVNNPDKIKEYRSKGVYGFYVDFY